MTPEEIKEQIDSLFVADQKGIIHESDTLEEWRSNYKDKRVTSKNGTDYGDLVITLDDKNHVVAIVGGGKPFPVSQLSAMVDARSLLLVDA